MPKLVKEISDGVSFSRSSENGQIADAQPRVFRVILSFPGELIDIQAICGVRIGDELRPGAKIYCTSFDARFEGSSRLVLICTFQFRSTADAASSGGGADPKSYAPEVRPANWSISSSLYEIPVWSWRERTGALTWGQPKKAANGVNDMYDGVSALDAIVTVSIEQFEALDPTRHARHVGAINQEQVVIGSLTMPPHTLMLRGVNAQPVAESWGGFVYRGWNCVYEFAYKANDTLVWIGTDTGGSQQTIELGWDIAVPQTGFNVKCFAPPGRAIDNPYGQPLELDEDTAEVVDPPTLPEDIEEGKKARAMVRIPRAKRSSLHPSAQPIAINDNGRPRAENLTPIVRAYQVHRDINFTNTLGLRLR